MPTATPRDIVHRILCRWTVLNDPPFLPERSHPEWVALAPRDRPFAYDMLTGILRWRNTLETIIAVRLKQPIETLDQDVRAALWLGAYQVLFQGTANYAAVDTTVELANKVNPKAAGLVNAILRGITRMGPRRVGTCPVPAGSSLAPPSASSAPAGATLTPKRCLTRRSLALDFSTELRFNLDIFPDPVKAPTAHLAVVRSHPAALVEHLRKIYGEMAGDILLRNNQRPLVTLRVDAEAVDIPAVAGLAAHATEARFLVALEGWSAVLEEYVEKGTLSPQDPTAAKPVRRLAALLGESGGVRGGPREILDYCAGLGTKTVQLARTFPEARITATDVDGEKLGRLEARVKRLKLGNVRVVGLEAVAGGAGVAGGYDVVLVDVPCSNTGVLGKRVQSRWRWPVLDRGGLAALQMKLMRQGAGLVAARGWLVYATCSIDPGENGGRVREFLGLEGGWRLVGEEATVPGLDVGATGVHDGGYWGVVGR